MESGLHTFFLRGMVERNRSIQSTVLIIIIIIPNTKVMEWLKIWGFHQPVISSDHGTYEMKIYIRSKGFYAFVSSISSVDKEDSWPMLLADLLDLHTYIHTKYGVPSLVGLTKSQSETLFDSSSIQPMPLLLSSISIVLPAIPLKLYNPV